MLGYAPNAPLIKLKHLEMGCYFIGGIKMELICKCCKQIFVGNKNAIYCKKQECRKYMYKVNDRKRNAKNGGYKCDENGKPTKQCKYCNRAFTPKENGARINHCSDKCYSEYRKAKNRERMQEFNASIREPKQIQFKSCKMCKALFMTDNENKQYCSDSCCSRARDKRLANVKADKGITLIKVAQKYNDICYLCGNRVDWFDCDKTNNKYYGNYPSIEHIIPIALGGTDTWDNINLAHRSCNSKKGTKVS